jgi:hypothetical protein
VFENILTADQLSLAENLLPTLKGYYLAGGTALALQIGHRKSIDFHLALRDPVNPFSIERNLIRNDFHIENVFKATRDEYSIYINRVRVTFFNFPFDVQTPIKWERCKISLPAPSELGAMKAYALGRRSIWKDYVDLFFLLKNYLNIDDMISAANKIFSKHFNEKLFREQLCYFNDIDFSETIEYTDTAPEDKEIKHFLESVATDI